MKEVRSAEGLSVDRVIKLTAFRQTDKLPTPSFIGEAPAYFEEIGNGLEITDLAIKFKVSKSLKKEPNPCEILIRNLSDDTARNIVQRPMRIRLEAGHDDVLRYVFNGDIRPGSYTYPDGPTKVTRLLVSDGGREFAEARINRSYKPGTQLRTVLRDAARSMGLELPPNIEGDATLGLTLPTGETSLGWSSDELTRLLAPYGYSWSIQNGKLQILRDEEVRQDEARLVDIDNGPLIGTPEIGTPGKKGKAPKVKFKTLLYPELVPGSKVLLTSRAVTGLYKLISVDHEGDNFGSDWTTSCEAVAIQGRV